MSFLFRLCLGFLLLTPVATRASVLEIPGTGSNLSGIGVLGLEVRGHRHYRRH